MKKILFASTSKTGISLVFCLSLFTPQLKAQTCLAPSFITSNSVSPDGAAFQWQQVAGATKYKVRIRPFKTNPWTVYSTTIPVIQINPVIGFYDYQVKSVCSGLSSNWSPKQNACFNCKLEVEPNNKFEQATLTQGAEEYWLYGQIAVSGDTDIFCIAPFPGDTLTSIYLNYGGSEKYRIKAVTKTGLFIGGSSTFLENLDGTDTLYFAVYGKDSAQHSNLHDYSILIKRTKEPQRFANEDSFNNFTESQTTISDIFISPNPGSNFISIESETFSLNDEPSVIAIYNIWGEKIFMQHNEANTADENCVIDISGLASGIYLVQLFNGSKSGRAKFIKE